MKVLVKKAVTALTAFHQGIVSEPGSVSKARTSHPENSFFESKKHFFNIRPRKKFL